MKNTEFVQAKEKIDSLFADDLWLDFEVMEYRPQNQNVLTIVASRDFSYYHNLEILLYEPKYFRGPFSWKNSPQESGLIEILDASENNLLIVENFIEDAIQGIRFLNDDGIEIIAAAKSIAVSTDVVLYYWKDTLAAGERIADWVKRPE